MKIELIVVGKNSDKNLMAAIADYAERIGHYSAFSISVVETLKNAKNLSHDMLKQQEGERIMKHIAPQDTVVLLDERGTERRSMEFAAWIEKKQLSTKKLVFIIGGAFGFSDEVYKRANEMISLSKMTFSHQMVRLFFVEQLYRAFTILKGENYHHE